MHYTRLSGYVRTYHLPLSFPSFFAARSALPSSRFAALSITDSLLYLAARSPLLCFYHSRSLLSGFPPLVRTFLSLPLCLSLSLSLLLFSVQHLPDPAFFLYIRTYNIRTPSSICLFPLSYVGWSAHRWKKSTRKPLRHRTVSFIVTTVSPESRGRRAGGEGNRRKEHERAAFCKLSTGGRASLL